MQKKKMSVAEFKRQYAANPPQGVTLCADNQPDGGAACPVRYSLSFSQLFVELNPNAVYLKERENCVWFNSVKYVLVQPEKTALGTAVDIVCSTATEKNARYTLIIA